MTDIHITCIMTVLLSRILTSRYPGNFSSNVINKACRCSKSSKIFRDSMDAISDLAYIEVKADNPLVLFKEWQQEAKNFASVIPAAFCLATVSKEGKVSARNLILRRLDEDGFVMMTDRRSQKSQNLSEVPSAAMCFLLAYKNDTGEHVSRQVRIEGPVAEMKKEDYQELYDAETLPCKIRSHVCHQGKKVEWDELKASHDRLLQSVTDDKTDLPMPDHFVAYKLTPLMMEFYYQRDHLIADRVLFVKDSNTDAWNHHHLAA
ncbi:pyridoxine/pyridoxamine 5'-phosphate oxidase [Diprion similis]|uniref:pyridoxine/pyridoxamine 5'-phosphate oxidase n=1 Tax=Diprion similis TaxID=362088 RepID=UPI001EF7C286|nr:pyridoxine/pyridoxamine 5'-phosphate oxidase [Diprion similis]